MKEKIIKCIIDEATEVLEEKREINKDTVLFGIGGLLDSMGLVSTIIAVEQYVEDEFGVQITIADQRAMSQNHSPFRTVDRLASYVVSLIEEEQQ